MEKPIRKRALMAFQKDRERNQLAEQGRLPFVVVLNHLDPAFNIGKIFRSSLAYGAREIHLIKTEYFNPMPAKGAFRKVPARFLQTFEESCERLRQEEYKLCFFDPNGTDSLFDAPFPRKSAFVFGNELHGLKINPADYEDSLTIRIPHLETVDSLNVSIAASIVMYEYFRRYG